jgi:hypothetical protein
LKAAGAHARRRIVAAGLRLGELLRIAESPGFLSHEELEKLPVGIKVVHEPEAPKARPARENSFGANYVWDYKTTVSSVAGIVRVSEFGAFVRIDGDWDHAPTVTGRPYQPVELL